MDIEVHVLPRQSYPGIRFRLAFLAKLCKKLACCSLPLGISNVEYELIIEARSERGGIIIIQGFKTQLRGKLLARRRSDNNTYEENTHGVGATGAFGRLWRHGLEEQFGWMMEEANLHLILVKRYLGG